MIRLQKIISEAGIASRRASEKLIADGKVRVNGVVVSELGAKADPAKDVITVNGAPIKSGSTKVYIVMNKPCGYVTTMSDPQGRAIVTSLLKDVKERVYPVGRLDYNTSGILLLTNDGEVANRLAHPSHNVLKTYRVKVKGILTAQELSILRSENKELGFRAPYEVRVESVPLKNTWLIISISQGKNRQIRRMCESINRDVLKLMRIAYGKITLGALKEGEYRRLAKNEEIYIKSL